MSPKISLLEHYKIKILRAVEAHYSSTRSGLSSAGDNTPGSVTKTVQFSQKVSASIFRAEESSTMQTGA